MEISLAKKLKSALGLGLTLLFISCGSGKASGGEGDYPMPGPEEQALKKLCQLLNYGGGYAMNPDSLAVVKDEQSLFSVALPTAEEDVLPRMGTYRNAETDGTITFRPYTNEKDTVNPICEADFHVAIHSWQDKAYNDSTETRQIHSHGKGILSAYHIVHGGGPNGGRHRCYKKHPDGYPEFWGMLMSVYPGADSLVVTWGYEDSKRVYRYEEKNN